MDFLKCRDVRWKGPEKRNKPEVVATTAKHTDSRRQISRYDWYMQVHAQCLILGKIYFRQSYQPAIAILLELPNIKVKTIP